MFEYKGWLRTIGGAIGGVGTILAIIPEPTVASIGQIMVQLGAAIGGIGVARAAVRLAVE